MIKYALKTLKMKRARNGEIVTGLHHTSVLPLIDKVIDLVNEGKIRHILVMGGCGVPSPKMSCYEKLAQMVSKDSTILTTACGKFRYNRRDYGTIEGIPRFMDFG